MSFSPFYPRAEGGSRHLWLSPSPPILVHHLTHTFPPSPTHLFQYVNHIPLPSHSSLFITSPIFPSSPTHFCSSPQSPPVTPLITSVNHPPPLLPKHPILLFHTPKSSLKTKPRSPFLPQVLNPHPVLCLNAINLLFIGPFSILSFLFFLNVAFFSLRYKKKIYDLIESPIMMMRVRECAAPMINHGNDLLIPVIIHI